MTPNKMIIACLPILATLLPTRPAHAAPAAGTNELRIESGYVFPGIEIRGFANLDQDGISGTQTIFGAGAGYGRFFTDNLELGASLKYLSIENGSSGVGIVPFVRAFTMVNDKLGVFAEGSLGAQYMMATAGMDARTLVTAGLDLGLEVFFTDDWALRLAPNYRYMHLAGGSSGSGVSGADAKSFGISWGIAAYW